MFTSLNKQFTLLGNELFVVTGVQNPGAKDLAVLTTKIRHFIGLKSHKKHKTLVKKEKPKEITKVTQMSLQGKKSPVASPVLQ